MKKTTQKKLQLSRIKIASLNKINRGAAKEGFICLTSLNDSSCPTCTRAIC
ncbi:hypothetical protein [Chitinophaga solisilvae]|uniref:Uncharacterized protein n=1 Tax=Chitinophaga solisilvae TaxID=1233460 RepID=A0A9Q5D8R1_9BACT|nr:hypothetical protein [Chitinophaga solisilvae]NSL87236.1 hypothetical protein [Chitinophaga solisilvae]